MKTKLLLLAFTFLSIVGKSQSCVNADFSDGNLTNWSGSYAGNDCSGSTILGVCVGCYYPNPTQFTGFQQGPNNDVPNDNVNEYEHVICTTAGGNDVNVATLLSSSGALPMAYPGGSGYSCRLGNMWQDLGNGTPQGGTLSYSFVVNAANCNFTYHYAVVMSNGSGHSNAEQPYFDITMVAGGTTIDCASYNVNANTAATIGGFNYDATDAVYWKPWSSVFIPLNNYLGQTVTITFTTRGCDPSGCAGSHYCYAYISAECAPLTLVASSPTVCGGQNLTLTAPNGAATYAWTGPGIVSGANSQIVTIDQPGQYVVNMTTFGNTPCTFSLDTVMVGNPANPQANFSATTVCQGTPTTFTDMSTPHASISAWSWDFGDGSTANTANPSHTYATAGTYPVTLTVTSSPCTKDTIINVTVSPPPTSTFTATSPVCEGTNSIVTYTGNAPAGDTYTWNFDGGNATPTTGQGPIAVNWNTGGTMTITLTVSAGACTSTPTSQQVVVNPFPGMTLTPYQSICAGGSANLVAAGATTYAWAADPSLSSTNTAAVTASPASTTTYTVTGTSANCVSIDTVTVGVYPPPISSFTAVTPVCVGQSSTVTFTGTASGSATYNWTFGGGTSVPAGGAGPLQVTWATAGTPSITLSITQPGCPPSTSTVPVTVNPSPTSTFTVTSPVCTGVNSTITFTGTADANAVYTWGFSGGTVVSGTNAGPYTVNWATAGTQNVTLSVTDNGCNSPLTTVPVIVNAIPTSDFTAVSPVCALSPSTLTYIGTASVNATYNWNFAGGVAAPGGTVQGPQSVVWTAAGINNVSLQVTENGCAGPTVTIPVTVNATPTSPFTATGPVCTGQTSTVTYTGTGDNLANYTWGFDGGTATPGTGQGPQSVTWATAGTKNITLQVSENGCTSPVTTVPVTVYPIPTATFTVTTPLCVGQNGTITFTGINTDANAQYTWSFGTGDNIVSGTNAGPYTVNWSAAAVGTQTVSLAVTDNGCVATPVSMPVVINAIPASFAGDDTAYCSGNSVIIGTQPTGGYTYAWSPGTGLSSAASSNPTLSLTNNTNSPVSQTYTVVTTSNGCTSTDAVNITVNPVPAPQFTMPAPQCLTNNSFSFTAGGTFMPTATIAWNFGTGAVPPTSTALSQTVVYSTPQTSGVTLTVSQVNCVTTVTDSATIYPMPVVSFNPDTVIGCENFNVCFVNHSLGVAPLTYLWHFGDGGATGDPNPCHLYVAPGVYTVYLKVTSSQNCSVDTTELNLIKVIADPLAMFTPGAYVIQQPESQIAFTNQSLNAVTYLWNFSNDGVYNNIIGNSTDVNPVYNFSQYGLYSVQLFAYNALNCVDSTTKTVKVLPPQNFFIPNAFTPNGDGANDVFFIYLQEGATLMSFQVFDRWGEKVHDGLYPWDGYFKGQKSPEGVYVYQAKIKLIDMNIDLERKGSVTLIR